MSSLKVKPFSCLHCLHLIFERVLKSEVRKELYPFHYSAKRRLQSGFDGIDWEDRRELETRWSQSWRHDDPKIVPFLFFVLHRFTYLRSKIRQFVYSGNRCGWVIRCLWCRRWRFRRCISRALLSVWNLVFSVVSLQFCSMEFSMVMNFYFDTVIDKDYEEKKC